MADPRIDYPDHAPGSVVEIRVHGVGGESPSVMARDPHPVVVAGDDVIGVHRARDPVVARLRPLLGRLSPVHTREVVSWGGQTSGSPRHALWVLLLPFAMFNAVGRMHRDAERGAIHRAVCRVLAVTMTLAVVGLACTLSFDLVAQQFLPSWVAAQCEEADDAAAGGDRQLPDTDGGTQSGPAGAGEVCVDGACTSGTVATPAPGAPDDESVGEPWSACIDDEPLPWWLVPFRAYDDDPLGRLALAALLPSLTIILLWTAGRVQHDDIEERGDDVGTADDPGAGDRDRAAARTSDADVDAADGASGVATDGASDVATDGASSEATRLADPRFWTSATASSRLRGLHVTAGTAWIALSLAMTAASVGADVGIVGVVAVLMVVVLVLVLAIAADPRVVAEAPDEAVDTVLLVSRALALGALGAMLGAWLPVGRSAGWIDRLDGGVAGAVAGALLVVAVLSAATWARLTWRPRGADARVWPNLFLVGAVLVTGVALAVGSGVDVVASPRAPQPAQGELIRALLGDASPRPYVPLMVLGVLQAALLLGLAVVSVRPGARYRGCPVCSESGDDAGRSVADGHVCREVSQLDDEPVGLGAAAVVVAMLSLFLVTAVGAGLHGLVADVLGDRVIGQVEDEPSGWSLDGDTAPVLTGGEAPTAGAVDGGSVGRGAPPPTRPLVVVPWMAWAAKILVGVLVGAALAGAWAFLVVGRRDRPTSGDGDAGGVHPVSEHLDAMWAAAGREERPDSLRRRDLDHVGGLWETQWMIRSAGHVLAWGVLAGVATLASVSLHAWADGRIPNGFSLSALDGFALWVVVGIPVLGAELLRRSWSERADRRNVGRVWDVLTFWPRVSHPLAPPCYASRLVPMIAERADRVVTASWAPVDPPEVPHPPSPPAEDPSVVNHVILAGHSQGSVVALAATLAMPERARRRTALVTYGSPVAILYERWFPEVFGPVERDGPGAFGVVIDEAHSWHHVFGLTEPFALPFWHVPELGRTDADVPPPDPGARDAFSADDVRRGWAVSRYVPPIERCPICVGPADPGDRSGPSDHDASPGAAGRRSFADVLVADPIGWDRAARGGRLLAAAGHSVYRGNDQLDAHLASLARRMAGPG